MAQQQRQANPQQPLDQLQGTLNLLLQLLGGVLSDPNKRKDPNLRNTFLRILPEANARFHDGLDKLEDDILKSERFMRREIMVMDAMEDMSALHAKSPQAEFDIGNDALLYGVESAAKTEPAVTASKRRADGFPKVASAQTQSPQGKETIDLTEADKTAQAKSPSKSTRRMSAELINTPKDTSKPATPNSDKSIKTPLIIGGDAGLNEYDAMFASFTQPSPDDDVSSLLAGLEKYASMPEASIPEASVPEASVPEASVPEASVPEASVPEGSMPDTTTLIPTTFAAYDDTIVGPVGTTITHDLEGNNIDEDYSTNDQTFEDLFNMDYEIELAGDANTNNDLDEWVNSF